ncbi:hypothetical protein Ddc_07136 [Ditylenchus destructor]|nr:hypothetical protein Ddc_07136 [Ditylenchus destructor]
MSGNWTSEEGETEDHQWILLGVGAVLIGALVILLLVGAAWTLYIVWNSRKSRRATHPVQKNLGTSVGDTSQKANFSNNKTVPIRAGILRGELERGLAPAFNRPVASNTMKVVSTNTTTIREVDITSMAKSKRPCRMESAKSPIKEIEDRRQRRDRSPSLVAFRSGGLLHQQHSLPALPAVGSTLNCSRISEKIAKSPSPSMRPLRPNSASIPANKAAKNVDETSSTGTVQPLSKQSSSASAFIYPSSPSAGADNPKSGSTDTARSSLSVSNGDTGSVSAERRPSRSQIIEEQLVGLESKLVPHDQEAEDEQREMVKKAIGPPEPNID